MDKKRHRSRAEPATGVSQILQKNHFPADLTIDALNRDFNRLALFFLMVLLLAALSSD
jgi:hypothetical protein